MNEEQSQEQIKVGEGAMVEIKPNISWWQKKVVKISVVVLLVVILIGAVFYKVYASPEKVWNRFSEKYLNSMQDALHENFEISYQDNKVLEPEILKANPYASMLNKIKVSLAGNAYLNYKNPENPEMSGDVTYSFSSGGTFLGSKLGIVLKDQNFYFKIGDIPFISEGMLDLNNGQKVDWVKINFKEMQEYINNSTQNTTTPVSLNEQIIKYQEIINKHWGKLITIEKVLNKEKIHNVNTIHFSNKLNKDELKNLFSEIFNLAFEEATKSNNLISGNEIVETKNLAINIINSIIDKIEIKKFETWIGVTDARIYKINVVTSAPSLVSFVNSMPEAEEGLSVAQTPQEKIDYMLSKISYEGEVTINEEFYDYGKMQEVKQPENALDMVEKIKEQDRIRNEMLESYKADANF